MRFNFGAQPFCIRGIRVVALLDYALNHAFVENHKIVEIKVIEADGIDAVPAKPILDKMIAENKIAVQAVKGAELGSLVYISCVDKALYNGINE